MTLSYLKIGPSLVGKGTKESGGSKELFRACSDKSIEDAQAQLSSPEAFSALATKGVSPLASTPLVEWWQDINWTGSRTVVYGADGSCDIAGYYLVTGSWWGGQLTSLRGYGQCTWSRLDQRSTNYHEYHHLPTSYVGNALNDNIRGMQVWFG